MGIPQKYHVFTGALKSMRIILKKLIPILKYKTLKTDPMQTEPAYLKSHSSNNIYFKQHSFLDFNISLVFVK
jgi:hypothetical protein